MKFAEENTFTQNEDGTVSITAKIPEGANVFNITVYAESGIGISLGDIYISDEPGSLGYNNNGYLNFEFPSPAVKGENLHIDISYYTDEYEQVENGILSGKAKYDGKHYCSVTERYDEETSIESPYTETGSHSVKVFV